MLRPSHLIGSLFTVLIATSAKADFAVFDPATSLLTLPRVQTADGRSAWGEVVLKLRDYELVSVASTAPPVMSDIAAGLYEDSVGNRYALTYVPNLTSDGRQYASLRSVSTAINYSGVFYAHFSTGELRDHPVMTSGDMQANCSKLGAGIFGYGSPNISLNLGGSQAYYNWASYYFRIRKIDARAIAIESLNNNCGVKNTQTLNRVGDYSIPAALALNDIDSGRYRDEAGNEYSMEPASGYSDGRTHWTLRLTKTAIGYSGNFIANLAFGSIANHPIVTSGSQQA